MKRYKRRFAALLAVWLLSMPVFPVAAAPQEKTEVVYAKMQGDGGIEEVLVVNGFETVQKELIDYGSYEQIINLTNTDPMERAGDRIRIHTTERPFYYQGKMKGARLPWEVRIAYEINGRSVPAEKIAGQSGELNLHIGIRPDEQAAKEFTDSYVLQIMVDLPGDRFRNVQAEGGILAREGDNTLVTFTLLPGKEGNFVITAEGEEMALGSIRMAGLPFAMDFDAPDLSEATDALLTLQKAIAQLTEGVTDFTDGVGSIYRATGALHSGARGLADGAYSFRDGMAEITSGMHAYQEGLDRYVSELERGIGAMEIPDMDTDGLTALTRGSDALYRGLQQLEEGMQHLAPEAEFGQGLHQVTRGAKELSAGMQTFMYGDGGQPGILEASNSIRHALHQMAGALTTGIPDIDEEGMENMQRGLARFIEGLQSFLHGLEGAVGELDPGQIRNLISGLYDLRETLYDSVYHLRNPGVDLTEVTPESNPEAYELYRVMTAEAEKIEARLQAIDAAIALIEDTDDLLDDIETMRRATQQMMEGVRSVLDELEDVDLLEMIDGMTRLVEGIVILSTQYEAFHEGLHTGLTEISEGLDHPQGSPGLVQGLEELSSGYAAMTGPILQGMAALVPGAGRIAAGIGQFAEILYEMAQQFDFADDLQALVYGSRSLRDGHRQMLGGADALERGLTDYARGADSYAGGMLRFHEGLMELAGGGAALAGGMQTLAAETDGMDLKMQEQMDEIMNEFLPADAPGISFVSKKNTGPVRVQFLYMTQPIHAPEGEEEITDPAEEKGLWQRILDLFR